MENNKCVTPGCGKPANLLCPVCSGLGLKTYFCSKPCFKSFWDNHKIIHSEIASKMSDKAKAVDTAAFDSFNYRGPLRPFEKTPMRKVPKTIELPDYAQSGIALSEQRERNVDIQQLRPDDVEMMRETCRRAREVLDLAIEAAKPGVTTDEIDRIVHEACVERECYPSPLNYFTFPKSCCTSINEIICHGIPDMRELQLGDILNIDISTFYKGFHGDLNETIFIGKPSQDDIKLVKCAYDCMVCSMDHIKPGLHYRKIGDFISKRARKDEFSVVRTYCGHGVHRLFHCNPNVPHYENNKAVGIIQAGHCFTIEPMINSGVWRDVTWPDRWTSSTDDGKKSAQFEHTMLVTTGESQNSDELHHPYMEILTKRNGNDPNMDGALANLSSGDKKHFKWYGRPHFIDQLVNFGFDIAVLFPNDAVEC